MKYINEYKDESNLSGVLEESQRNSCTPVSIERKKYQKKHNSERVSLDKNSY